MEATTLRYTERSGPGLFLIVPICQYLKSTIVKLSTHLPTYSYLLNSSVLVLRGYNCDSGEEGRDGTGWDGTGRDGV